MDNEDLVTNAEQATLASTAAGAKVKAALKVSVTAKKALRDAQRALTDARAADVADVVAAGAADVATAAAATAAGATVAAESAASTAPAVVAPAEKEDTGDNAHESGEVNGSDEGAAVEEESEEREDTEENAQESGEVKESDEGLFTFAQSRFGIRTVGAH